MARKNNRKADTPDTSETVDTPETSKVSDADFLAQSLEGLGMTELQAYVKEVEARKVVIATEHARAIHEQTIERDNALVDYDIALNLAKIKALGMFDEKAAEACWMRIKDIVFRWVKNNVCKPKNNGNEYMPEDMDKMLSRRFPKLVEAGAPAKVFTYRTAFSRMLVQHKAVQVLDSQNGRFKVLVDG